MKTGSGRRARSSRRGFVAVEPRRPRSRLERFFVAGPLPDAFSFGSTISRTRRTSTVLPPTVLVVRSSIT